jgi:hypothetical protein
MSKNNSIAATKLSRWKVPSYLMASALESGMKPKESPKDRTSRTAYVRRGRFLLLAAERQPEIADDLFHRAFSAFEKLIHFKKLYRVLSDEDSNLLHRAGGLMAEDENKISEEEMVIETNLISAVSGWADRWLLSSDGFNEFHYFALAALVGGSHFLPPPSLAPIKSLGSSQEPARLPGQPKIYPNIQSGWNHAAIDTLKLAHLGYIHPAIRSASGEIFEKFYKPPDGLALYLGIGRETYIKEAEAGTQWVLNNMLPLLSPSIKRDVLRDVIRHAKNYCKRVEEMLDQKRYVKFRSEPNFERDLEWTVSSLIRVCLHLSRVLAIQS